MTLNFDPKEHIYTVDGRVVPSVTQVLNEWQKIKLSGMEYYVNTWDGTIIPAEIFENAGAIGKAVHKGARILVNGGKLNWEKLPEPLIHPLREFQRWMEEHEAVPVLSESPMYCEEFDYAGTLDLVCHVKDREDPVLIDYKTSENVTTVGPQTAAYLNMFLENHAKPLVDDRYVLILPKKEGKEYLFEPLDSFVADWEYFESCLYKHKWRTGREG
jgi:hypothetical protein